MKLSVLSVSPLVTSWGFRFISFLIFTGILLLTQVGTIKHFRPFVSAAILNSILLSATSVLSAKALKESDISIVSPLMALIPVTVIIPAWVVLDEKIPFIAILGILLVCLGAYFLEAYGKTDSLLEPIRRLRYDKGAQYMGLFLIVGSFIPTIDKIGLQQSSPTLWLFSTHLGMSIILGVFVLYFTEIRLSNFTVGTDWNTIKPLVLIGASNAIVSLLQINAYVFLPVSYVQAIKRVSIFISISVGYYFFGEENIKNRLLGAIFIFIGIVLIIFTT